MTNLIHDQYASLWARQLQREFTDICWKHQVALPLPIITISQSTSHLGEWRQALQTITISNQLILHHPWSVTINVFKHEMAHQLCAASGQGEAGHGPQFQLACLRLGVPEAYRTARGDSPEVFTDLASESEMVMEGRRFFAKVEKLLALARSENEHEAALAMQKANELIEKYNLQQMTSDQARRYAHRIISLHKKRVAGWQGSIGGILIDFFYVKIVYAYTYDPLADQQYKTIELFGLAENVAVAEYCYHFLERELIYLWEQNRARFPGRTMTEKRSYWLGLLHGFRQKLQAKQPAKTQSADRQATPATTSVMVVEADWGLNEFVSQRFPRLKTTFRAGPRINRSTYDHGAADGKNIVLHKGVGSQDGNQGRFLGHC